MHKDVLNDTANWQIKTTGKLHRVPTPCLDDHQFRNEELETVGELFEVCAHNRVKIPVLTWQDQ